MDFTFSEDQLLFCKSVQDFLQQEITPKKVRDSWELDGGRNPALWQQLVDLGVTAMLVPEAQGGLGMNELDFVLLAQACGQVALPEPLVETVLVATPLLAALAQRDARCASLLEKIATGERRVAIGHAVNNLVCDAHIADFLLLPSGNQIHLVARDDVKLTAQESVDPSRRLFAVEWRPTDETCLAAGPEGVALLAATLNRGALGTAAQLVGLAEAMVQMTVKYTSD
ncbi:MAG TPA: acyl-CoA dehydrogenase family protein, partial [Dongiaceae bacterium]|nr:acyl-CoA dehydrogenase family protein [Dongiaceae bacterium]